MHCSFSPDGVIMCAAELELCSPHLKSSACCILVFIGCLICELDTLEWQLLRPIYKRMADNQNAELFAANTLLVVLATSLLTARVLLSSPCVSLIYQNCNKKDREESSSVGFVLCTLVLV